MADPTPDPDPAPRKPGRNPWFNLLIWVVLAAIFWRATQGGGPSFLQDWPELSRIALGISLGMALYCVVQGVRGRNV